MLIGQVKIFGWRYSLFAERCLFRESVNWIVEDDYGVASMTIYSVLRQEYMAVVPYRMISWIARVSLPHDSVDFGRCVRLLDRFPGWRKRLNEVGIRYPAWRPLIDQWNQIEDLYRKDELSEVNLKLQEFQCGRNRSK